MRCASRDGKVANFRGGGLLIVRIECDRDFVIRVVAVV
jgi:hypothetical protein